MNASSRRTSRKTPRTGDEVTRQVCAALERLKEPLRSLSPIEQAILEDRLLREPSLTLAAVGTRFDKARELIRRIQVKVKDKFESAAIGPEVRLVVSLVDKHFAQIMEREAFDQRLEVYLGSGAGLPRRIFRKAVIDAMGYVLQNGAYVDERAREFIEKMPGRARKLADDAGLVDIERLLGWRWHRYWPLLRQQMPDLFHEMHGSFSLRNTARARTKAALVSIGRAATREEVAAVCRREPRPTANALSNLESVVRVRKDLWALKEWAEEEYISITAAIIRRIEEDGGSTAIERLLRELPEAYGVSPSSVNIYTHMPKFVRHAGRIRLATASDIKVKPLHEAVHGHDTDGAPYFTFPVKPTYLTGRDGVRHVPPAFVKALGCKPGGTTYARVENLPMCRPLSAHWSLTSTSGPHLGHVTDALNALGLKAGQIARVTLKGTGVVMVSEHREDE